VGLTVGLPRMTEHPGERRDLLPRFVHRLVQLGADEVVVEDGYGAALEIGPDPYLHEQPQVRSATATEVLAQDVVLVLRCPMRERLELLRPGSILVTMLHYATRPARNDYLEDRKVRMVSLDSVVDDRGRRLVENLELTAWTGVAQAFRQLSLSWGMFAVPSRQPIRVTILGSGALGGHAVHAATRYGDHEVRDALHRAGVPGVEVAVADHDLSWHEGYMLGRLRATDILVDATFRADVSIPVVPNAWLEALPSHAVLLDLAADPYDRSTTPPGVKGFEGIPHGSLDQHVFGVDDPAWDAVADLADTTNRRTALSCDAWPGLRPKDSMERYGEQLESVMEVVLGVPIDAWDRRSPYDRERAVARAEWRRWKEGHGC
jgi:alanine dehydrogenase